MSLSNFSIKWAHRLQEPLSWRLLSIVMALCTYKVFAIIHEQQLNVLVDAAYGVTIGKPHWLAFQNRLAGPYLMLWLSQAGMSLHQAWGLFNAMAMAAESLLLFELFKRQATAQNVALFYIPAFWAIFLFLQDQWYYPWDSIDLILFTLMAYTILNQNDVRLLLALFFVGIVNRETALFIPVYLMIDGLHIRSQPARITIQSKAKLLTGLLLFVAGAAYTHWIRDHLFISRPNGLADSAHAVLGNHFYLLSNMKRLIFTNFLNANYILSVVLLGMVLHFTLQVHRYTERELKCYLTLLAILGFNLTFGAVNESRIYLVLLPFAFFLHARTHPRQGLVHDLAEGTEITTA
jgi:hypothetical protein